MRHLIRNSTILDAASPFNGKKVDILLEDGQIQQMKEGSITDADAVVIDGEGCYMSPGFCDLYVHIADPGFEQREDIRSVAKAALAGGFTTICAIAGNHPITQSKAQVEYIIQQSKQTGVRILPIGAITENFDGKTPTEMYDMHHAGAVAFSDMPQAVKNSGVMMRALQYVQPFGGLIMTMPYDQTLVGEGQVNESERSVRMGMKGITNLSEYSIVQRDIELLRYAGGKLHMAGISASESVALIRKAKQDGLQISCSVFVHHLVSTEEAVSNFDSNFKVFPPLRTEADRAALLQGLEDGTIDAISTQHTPLDIDHKNVEFEYAENGMIGLETAFGLLVQHLGERFSREQLVNWLSSAPAGIIGKSNSIREAAPAEMTLLDFDTAWTFTEKDIRSKSKNTPYIGTPLKGKVKAVFSGNTVTILT